MAVTNTTIDGAEAYATNDLVVPHPKRSGYWKLIGRRDDQIVLANGEKVGRKLHARLVTGLTRIPRLATQTNPLPLGRLPTSPLWLLLLNA